MSANPGTLTVRLQGGLGNQLFQYALGRKLATDGRNALVFDTTWYENGKQPRHPRPLALREFAITGIFKSHAENPRPWIRPSLAGRIWGRIEQRFLPLHRRRYVGQNPGDFLRQGRMFDPRVLKVRPGSYLSGWWISPHYFTGIEASLRREIVLRQPVTPRVQTLLDRIGRTESVAIHVRRGDYLQHPEIGVLDPAYYARAIAQIRQRIPKPSFFVFSDDNDAARLMLAKVLPDFELVVLEPGGSPAIDLHVMSACKHFINANSTFSWWGAWLGRSEDKIVIVPEHWYSGAKIKIPDVYPAGWSQIPD